MPEKDMMVRVKRDIYLKLNQKRLQYISEFKCNYTLSEIIELLILKDNIYGDK